jgi:hypothetical protein
MKIVKIEETGHFYKKKLIEIINIFILCLFPCFQINMFFYCVFIFCIGHKLNVTLKISY